MRFFGDFKKFVFKGNLLNTAIGLAIGSAFTAVVNSLVKDIFMPIIGYLSAGIDFTSFKVILRAADAATETPEVAITYGVLIQAFITFLLVGLTLFLVVRSMSKMQERQKAAEAATEAETEPEPTETELLSAILDELRAARGEAPEAVVDPLPADADEAVKTDSSSVQ